MNVISEKVSDIELTTAKIFLVLKIIGYCDVEAKRK